MHNYRRERSTRKGDCAQTEAQTEETCTKLICASSQGLQLLWLPQGACIYFFLPEM